MVSRKCTCQLSSSQRLPIAAAMPPSAITVCALPSSDLQTSAVRAPASCAAIAARRPAPPAPITTTSYWWLSSPRESAPPPADMRLPVIGWRPSMGVSVGVDSLPAFGLISEEPRIGEGAAGEQHHVEVGQGDREQ